MGFGELWIDQPDADARLAALDIAAPLREQLQFFMRHGYVVIERAVSAECVDAVVADHLAIQRHPERYVLKGKGRYIDPGQAQEKLRPGDRVVDLYGVSPAARASIFNAEAARFLAALFGEPAIAMQSITFEFGSQQAMHQDTAYVISEKPLSLAASWLALEDVVAGSGELIYYPGSHRFDHFLFGEGKKGWSRGTDGAEVHQQFLQQLHTQAKQRNLKRERFLARKGDVLFWHADLAHGGSRITADATRRSLVTHFVPQSVKARYRSHLGDAYCELPSGNGHLFTSRHYDLRRLDDNGIAPIFYDGGISRLRASRSPR